MSEISRDGVHHMFDAISKTYDCINRVMTFGQDMRWRGKLRTFLPKRSGLKLLDLATGTGDQILALADNIETAIGIDLSQEMLKIGKQKCKHLGEKVRFDVGDAMDVGYADSTFDAVTMSFGIRNVCNTSKCLEEMKRVLKKDGRALILEGGVSQNRLIRFFHLFYMRNVMPLMGRFISKHRTAYRYLNQTIESYPCGEQFCELLEKAGFKNVKAHPMMLGSVYLYVAHT